MQSSVLDYQSDLHRVPSRLALQVSLMTLAWWPRKQLAQELRPACKNMRTPTIADAIVASDIAPLVTADRGVDEISEALEKSLRP